MSRRGLAPALLLLGLTGVATTAVAAEPGLRDPTRPPGMAVPGRSGAPAPTRWVLSSTLIAPGRRLATINGRTVAVGEHIAGAVVEAIWPAQVRLRSEGREFVVELLPGSVKRPVE